MHSARVILLSLALCACGAPAPEIEIRPDFFRRVGASLRHSFSVHEQTCTNDYCDTHGAPQITARVASTGIASVEGTGVDSDAFPFVLRGLSPGTSSLMVESPAHPAIVRPFEVAEVARSAITIGLPNPRSYVFDEVVEDPSDPNDSPRVLVRSSILMLQYHHAADGAQLFGAADWTVSGPTGVQIEQVGHTFVPSSYQFAFVDESLFTPRSTIHTGSAIGTATIGTSAGGTFTFEVVGLDAVESVSWLDSSGNLLPDEFVFDAPLMGLSVNIVPYGFGGASLFGEGPPIQVTRIAESPLSPGAMVVDFYYNYRAIELQVVSQGTVTLQLEWAGFQRSIDIRVEASAIAPPFRD